jgi:hypothetical protein
LTLASGAVTVAAIALLSIAQLREFLSNGLQPLLAKSILGCRGSIRTQVASPINAIGAVNLVHFFIQKSNA